MDYADTSIRVTEIMPGMVRTNFAATRFGDQRVGDRYYDDFGECLTPKDIAKAVVYAVQQSPTVVVAQIVIVPIGQA